VSAPDRGAPGLRIGVAGATGALGSELLGALSGSRLAIAGLRCFASEHSLGSAIEFRGDEYPIALEAEGVAGLDLLFLCAPPAASLAFLRLALHAEVPCIDLSGAMAARAEVPLRAVDRAARGSGAPAAPEAEPLVAAPDGASLALFRVLQPLCAESAPRRAVVTLFDAASVAGRRAIDALYRESLAIFNQQELPEPEHFDRPVAFDCLPRVGELDAQGESAREARVRAELARLLAEAGCRDCALFVSAVQVPAFVGLGASVFVETAEPADAKRAAERLRAAPGVALSDDPGGPTLRAGAGAEDVAIGRLRAGPGGLGLWLAADPLRLAAAHAVALAELRLSQRPGALRARTQ